MSSSSIGSQAPGPEPPMFLQRPSSARSQDITHVLARTFRELFTREAVGPDTVKYLNISRGGEDEYHEKYVEALHKVQQERDRRMAEAAMLERHIMQAQARAMSAEEREINRVSSASSGFPDLGLPPTRAHFRSCINSEVLRKHNLITPEDFATEESPIVPPPQGDEVSQRGVQCHGDGSMLESRSGSSLNIEEAQVLVGDDKSMNSDTPKIPSYARDTVSSQVRKSVDADGCIPSPLPQIMENGSISASSLSSLVDPDDVGDSSSNMIGSATWKNQMNPEEREQNRAYLANIQARVDYLKNQRFIPPSAHGAKSLIKAQKKQPKEVGIKPKPEKETPKEPSVVFVPNPAKVIFSDYVVGQVYEMTLELKNVTTVLRPVRVIPPKTSYFSVGLGQFPGEHGLVAPGMSCHYTLRFAPDSLSDFDDSITIQTQSSTPLVIPVLGRRPPPCLNIPSKIDIGQCLVGGCKVTRLVIRNTGGPGRFCMMQRSSWPATNFKSIVAGNCISMPQFDVRPAMFELAHNEVTNIEILFTPGDVQEYSQVLTMTCDNCQVQHFTLAGEGQRASVDLVDVEGNLAAMQPGELSDVSAFHLLKFDSLNPYTYYQRSIVVRNNANVDVPYNWVVVKPLLRAPDPRGEIENEQDQAELLQERIHDVDSAFSVEPQGGMLGANESTKFTITFAPPEVMTYHSVLHLILRDIPAPKDDATSSVKSDSSDSLPPTNSNLSVTTEPETQDMTALEVEVKGECDPFSVVVQPYAVFIPGTILVTTPVKRAFRVINSSISSIVFAWEKYSSSYIMQVEPPVGEIPGQSEMDFEVIVSGSKPGKVNHTLLCHVQHLAEPLTLHVEAEIKGPEMTFEVPSIDFELVRFGEKKEKYVLLRNKSQISARWNIRESPTHVTIPGSSEFIFSPSHGELQPFETVEVKVVFNPQSCKSLRSVFELLVEDGNQSALSVYGEVQRPFAELPSQYEFHEVYVDVPAQGRTILLNKTYLATKFRWGEPEGEQAHLCSISIKPSSGDLGAVVQQSLAIDFTAHTCGPINVCVPCYVDGMDGPLYLNIICDVKPLQVSYSTPNDADPSSNELLLNFGDVKLGSSLVRRIIMKNNSGITAPFSLNVENFLAKPPTPPEKRQAGFMPNKSHRRSLLNKTANLADPLSKTNSKAQNDLARVMLQSGRGAAFSISPGSGMLQPFAEQEVEITAFADMWGEYNDVVTCKVEKLSLVTIPVSMSVRGCPLHFQMVAAQAVMKPILRFGTHVSGVGPITRQMRINNTSPYDLRVDWQVFNEDSSDRKLLDMITSFGGHFPLLDNKGNEVVPPVSRQGSSLTTGRKSCADEAMRSSSQADIGSQCDTDRSVDISDLERSRPKLISVFVREHGGQQLDDPYKITPKQVVIPAHGNSCINVTFTPPPNQNKGMDCSSFAFGYMSVEGKTESDTSKVLRAEGYEVTPLRLDMTAHVKPALLTIECKEDDGMRYRAAASDLLYNGQLISEKLHLCSTVMSNNTETPLVFRLLTCEPFQLIHLDARTGQPVAQLLQSENINLRPRENVLVQVGFRVSMELLEYVESPEALEEQEGIELETVNNERKLHFKHDLVVEFNNTTTQTLPLHATLIVPSLMLSKETVDFGTCLVGQKREMQLTLTNPTGSTSFWAAVEERRSKTCSDGTFDVTPSSGMLDAHVTHVSRSKVLVKVFFTATHTEEYEAVFLFHGMLGESPCRLTVKGQGSYDGKHEAIINV